MDGMNQSNNQNHNGWNHGSPYGQPGGYYYQPTNDREQKNSFFTASLILGIVSLLTFCTFFLPLPLGALGILFVCLGKRRNGKINTPGTIGLVTSIIGMVLGCVLTVFTLVSAFNLLKPENRGTLNTQFEQIYGMDFEEYMEYIYGEDYADYLEQFDNLYQ